MTPRRIYPAQWRLAVEVVASVVQEGRAADRLLQHEFRQRKQMGGRDRAVVTDLVYGVLRDLRRLQRIAGGTRVQAWCAVLALEAGQLDAETLSRLGFENAEALVERLARFDAATLTPAERCNVPDAIFAIWCDSLGAEQAAQLGVALQTQAPVDLRVNTLRSTRDQARAALRDDALETEALPLAPNGLRLPRRAALQNAMAYREGWIEPQDQGSQLLALLVAAQPGEKIADYCAGAGGKTLALAAQMQDQGELWAMDTELVRLERLGPRLERAGINCVRIHTLNAGDSDNPLSAQHGSFDAVLVDAPCTGTGTWRRQPEARLKVLDLAAMAQLQGQILADAAMLVRPGGRLIYGTCSLLPAENQQVIAAFLGTHADFARVDASAVLAQAGVTLAGMELQLYPHRHDTDGFFGVCLQ
ncbi:MAG: RsmB/NOP family class I SAM-dependent RNA methyltransferase, partial [Pseudomonadota bacterium]|nr:RsmB/NOP family class I SAM-dependent RNA methyltransferase [Pseudomonadota bacterium]